MSRSLPSMDELYARISAAEKKLAEANAEFKNAQHARDVLRARRLLDVSTTRVDIWTGTLVVTPSGPEGEVSPCAVTIPKSLHAKLRYVICSALEEHLLSLEERPTATVDPATSTTTPGTGRSE